MVRVVNTHLESLRAGDQLRPCQLQGCVQVLKGIAEFVPESKLTGAQTKVFAEALLPVI